MKNNYSLIHSIKERKIFVIITLLIKLKKEEILILLKEEEILIKLKEEEILILLKKRKFY